MKQWVEHNAVAKLPSRLWRCPQIHENHVIYFDQLRASRLYSEGRLHIICYAMLFYARLCHGMLYCNMLCFNFMVCYVLLCYVFFLVNFFFLFFLFFSFSIVLDQQKPFHLVNSDLFIWQLEVNSKNHFQNVLNNRLVRMNNTLRARGQVPSKRTWGMRPTEVNAYYDNLHNKIGMLPKELLFMSVYSCYPLFSYKK